MWIAYHSGTRKAREYSDGTYNNFQTTTITSGYLSFVVLSNDNLVAGGFDSKLHIFDGNLIDQKNDPGAYISSLFEPEDGLLLAGTGNGELLPTTITITHGHTYQSIGLALIKL